MLLAELDLNVSSLRHGEAGIDEYFLATIKKLVHLCISDDKKGTDAHFLDPVIHGRVYVVNDERNLEIVNVRAGTINLNSDLDITFYVENVFDKRGDLRVRTEDSLLTFKWTTRPRTMGVDISKRF